MKHRAVFFDRDGILNDTVDRGEDFFVQGKKVRYTAPFSYKEFCPKTGIEEVLNTIHSLDFLCILVTNQPDITYGTMSLVEHERIMSEVKTWPLDDIFVCMHGRDGGCVCKKPLPGMILEAAKKWNIDLGRSFIVGDTQNDIQAGTNAGCQAILIDAVNNQELAAEHRIKNLDELPKLLSTL
ncbi:MAG: hypothetical protein A2821_03060 [Candidatus Magasanikbacteria bacterium RIFCSPHIGHO2_01_FULL_41_23]|uniref:D,D-heptose 1,7-bisphosphate phosphatase n=1 Tax=Candidatus Magasanikbacteria bacterium RIFCSPLOWO2_01_FULL_40_15 TaxID=1798686 RepID=A0A1F6N3L6_9BACT|nr:MAG: hypothetical protein A2821_03060 [Candidatus Magasanikbacteria bacterium RIFCSPHIGHO2_01_FULL_41_23]OGH67317.1 MAG: hypothetical protein A3C66_01075 [Candidatus Magasanikbacteria bacterium RIFCSPHIGHO2_02_FULL_41_35]OGH76542.1 MAG: hypothetical protein A3F22_00285 [Candidatus Magasanikbacteria bacterium RIFCSPHIGHO2_12_FULL_41_16]OGH78472.1 MAG: hypothetical protein A2983_03070 [Candidatus Magasanikbacteria bacterium RIFCSPLOWO2_01_FULL_40_15]